MTSMRRFRMADRVQRGESPGSAAIAVLFVVVANLMLFGVLAAVLLPRSDADAKSNAVRAPAVAMALPTPSRTAPAARESISAGVLPKPAAALARPSVTPGGPSLVLARSAHRVRRVCPSRESWRVSLAQHSFTPTGPVRIATP